jgi:hypothetical protein
MIRRIPIRPSAIASWPTRELFLIMGPAEPCSVEVSTEVLTLGASQTGRRGRLSKFRVGSRAFQPAAIRNELREDPMNWFQRARYKNVITRGEKCRSEMRNRLR